MILASNKLVRVISFYSSSVLTYPVRLPLISTYKEAENNTDVSKKKKNNNNEFVGSKKKGREVILGSQIVKRISIQKIFARFGK